MIMALSSGVTQTSVTNILSHSYRFSQSAFGARDPRTKTMQNSSFGVNAVGQKEVCGQSKSESPNSLHPKCSSADSVHERHLNNVYIGHGLFSKARGDSCDG